jgi:3-hydroxyacyl-CoA dehydrogenase
MTVAMTAAMPTEVVHLQPAGAVRIIEIDNPPVNQLSLAVRVGFQAAVRAVAADPVARAVVVCCAGRTFSSGADLRELDGDFPPPSMPELITALEALPIPVVAALHGFALGGGLEVGLGCHWRVAARDAKLGTPEVGLGLLPGAGGTQRLPRLLGIRTALDVMLGGQPMSAEAALKLGLVDEVVDAGDLRAAAVARAEALIGTPPRRTCEIAYPADAAEQLRAALAALPAPQTLAPRNIVACVQAAVLSGSFAEGRKAEDRLFDEVRTSAESRALRHLFFAEREVARLGEAGTRRAEAIASHLQAAAAGHVPGSSAWLSAVQAAAPAALALSPDAKPIEVDVAAVARLGYPRHLGGPLHHAAHAARAAT